MSRLTIDELETLTPDELVNLLFYEINNDVIDYPDVQFIQDLLTVGCPINFRNIYEWNQTPLHCVVHNWDIQLIKFLISKGANINLRDNSNYTAWDYASKKIREACPELEPK